MQNARQTSAKCTFSKGHQYRCFGDFSYVCLSVCLSSAKQTILYSNQKADWTKVGILHILLLLYLLPPQTLCQFAHCSLYYADLPGNSKQGPLSLQSYNKVEDISPQHKLQLGKHLSVRLWSLLLSRKTGQQLAYRLALLNKLAVTTASLALIETPWGTRRKLSTWCGWFLLTVFLTSMAVLANHALHESVRFLQTWKLLLLLLLILQIITIYNNKNYKHIHIHHTPSQIIRGNTWEGKT